MRNVLLQVVSEGSRFIYLLPWTLSNFFWCLFALYLFNQVSVLNLNLFPLFKRFWHEVIWFVPLCHEVLFGCFCLCIVQAWICHSGIEILALWLVCAHYTERLFLLLVLYGTVFAAVEAFLRGIDYGLLFHFLFACSFSSALSPLLRSLSQEVHRVQAARLVTLIVLLFRFFLDGCFRFYCVFLTSPRQWSIFTRCLFLSEPSWWIQICSLLEKSVTSLEVFLR